MSLTPSIDFPPMPKIGRLSRDMIVTEKLDGTNASVYVAESGNVYAASRTRWITPEADNYGFARWVAEHAEELKLLGPGHHFGEWWGQGIQRGYGLKEKRFWLFNVGRWEDPATRPACVGVVPVLARHTFDTRVVDAVLEALKLDGSVAVPGWMQPEGVVVFHAASNTLFKKTLDKNDGSKTLPPIIPEIDAEAKKSVGETGAKVIDLMQALKDSLARNS